MEKDKLTGLLMFDDFVAEAMNVIDQTSNDNYLLISSDISKFKYINRLYGYEEGDRLIRYLAEIFTNDERCILACRPYSDHIIGIYKYTNGLDRIDFEREMKVVQELFVTNFKSDFPKASLHLNIGIYLMSDWNEPITSMIDKANVARRSEKGNYSISCAFYTEKINRRKEGEERILPVFERALEKQSILVYMQPKMSVEKKCIVGAEALTRLVDEEGNLIPPDDYIPILEDSGKVIELDRYVMKFVFKKIRAWLEEGKNVLPISINLSKIHFYYDNLVDDIMSEFEKYNIPSQLVEFEVTESVFFEEAELIISKIEQLRKHGFKVSVDDFGAGYSSLNMIGVLPVDIIKLDKGFIKNSLGNRKGKEIIKGLIQILNEIDMEIICEGIETKEEERVVYEFGCDSMQGFLYDRPIPIGEFEEKYIK